MPNLQKWCVEGLFTSYSYVRNGGSTLWVTLPSNGCYDTHENDIAITLHNLAFQARVMGQARDSIMNGTFPTYLRQFFAGYFGNTGYPEWCVNALRSVGVDLMEGNPDGEVVKGDGARWEYADVA